MLYGWDIPPASTRPWYLPFTPPSAQTFAPASYPIEQLSTPSSPIIDVVGTPTPDGTWNDEEDRTISSARPCAQSILSSPLPNSVPLASSVAAPAGIHLIGEASTSTFSQPRPHAQSSQPISALASLLTAPTAAQPSTPTISNARPVAQSLPFPIQRISVPFASLLAAPSIAQPDRRDPCAIFQAKTCAQPMLSPSLRFSMIHGSFPVAPPLVADTSSIIRATPGAQSLPSSSICSIGNSISTRAVEDINAKRTKPHENHTDGKKKGAIGIGPDGAIRKRKFEKEARDAIQEECQCSCTTRSCDYCKLRPKRICAKVAIVTSETAEQSDQSTDTGAEPSLASVSNQGSDHSAAKELSEKEKSIAMMVYALDEAEKASESASCPISVVFYEKPSTRAPTDEELRDAQLAIALVIWLDSDSTDAIDIAALANIFLTGTILVPTDFEMTMPAIASRIHEAIDKLFRVFRDV